MTRRSARRGIKPVEVLVVIVCLLVLIALVLPALQGVRHRARPQCNNNLHNISLSLQNYHDTYKVFPMGAIFADCSLSLDQAKIKVVRSPHRALRSCSSVVPSARSEP